MRLYCALPGITLLALAHTLGASTKATAQDMPPVAVGERVRVSTESGATHVGLVTALSSGALELQGEAGSQPFSVPMASMTRLEVRRQHSKAVIGLLVGAGAGALAALAYCGAQEGNCVIVHFNGGRNDFSNELPFSLGVVGGVAGALVGRNMKTDRWEGVPLDRLRVSLAPQRDGRIALGFSVRF